ncbi:MAG: rhomboid family intramembrane serine protease [Acidimicrobiales bacterium]
MACLKAEGPQRTIKPQAGGGVPRVTAGLLIANLVVFLLLSGGGLIGGVGASELGGGSRLTHGDLGLNAPAVAAGQWWRLITSGFIHFGFMHLAFNMAALYRFGQELETAFGRVPFAALYFASLLAGSFGALVTAPDALTGGASGAVFGLFGAGAMVLKSQGLKLRQTDLGGLLAVNLVITFVIPGISIGGHLGGLVGGAVVGWLLVRSPRWQTMSSSRSVPAVVLACVVGLAAVAGSITFAQGWV